MTSISEQNVTQASQPTAIETQGEVSSHADIPSLKIDLENVQNDKSLSLHKFLSMRVQTDDFAALFKVIDLEYVYMSPEASEAIKRCYLTPEYLLDRYGHSYKKNIVAEATRGTFKGMKYINAEANEYAYSTDDGTEIVVAGKCVELDGKKTRQIHITCRPQKLVVVPESVGQ